MVSPWSAGVFASTDSQPYRDAEGQFRVLPFVSYRGERLEWFGPLLRWRLGQAAGWKISAHGMVDFPAYEEDDAPILKGLGDRSTSLLLGVDTERDLGQGWGLALSFDAEVLGEYDGLQATTALTRRIGSPRAPLFGGASMGLYVQDDAWTDYRVGVPESKAREDRPAYDPGTSFHPFVGLRAIWRISAKWQAVAFVRYEFLDDTWRDSPLISDSGRLTSLLTLSRSF